jgi:hypothetical protein
MIVKCNFFFKHFSLAKHPYSDYLQIRPPGIHVITPKIDYSPKKLIYIYNLTTFMVSFIWKSKNKEVEITTLTDLLNTLVALPLSDIDQEIKNNIINGTLVSWIKENFPKQLILTTSLESVIKEYTPQQIREMLIRALRSLGQENSR